MSMKQLTISGRLGKDAEIKQTARGTKYLSFTLAVDSRNKDGEKETEWYNVTSFQENHMGKLFGYLKKGSGLIVNGTPSYSIWHDKNGDARLDLNVRAFNIEFPSLGGNRDNADGGQRTQERQAPVQNEAPVTRQAAPTYQPSTTSEPEDDLPF